MHIHYHALYIVYIILSTLEELLKTIIIVILKYLFHCYCHYHALLVISLSGLPLTLLIINGRVRKGILPVHYKYSEKWNMNSCSMLLVHSFGKHVFIGTSFKWLLIPFAAPFSYFSRYLYAFSVCDPSFPGLLFKESLLQNLW